jgi:hypothetical protein
MGAFFLTGCRLGGGGALGGLAALALYGANWFECSR